MFYNMQWHKKGIGSPFASPLLNTISGALGLSGAANIVYSLLASLNASQTAPLTALVGTNPTQVATSAVVIPNADGTLITIAANKPAIPGADHDTDVWTAPGAGETATVLASGLTRYTGGGQGNPSLAVIAGPSDTLYGRYPRDLTQSTYWTASNITPLKNATGPDGVTNSASTITAGADNGTILQAVTLASGTRGFFPYVKRKTGTGAVYVTVDNGSTWTEITVTSSWARYSKTQAAVTNPIYGFKLATSGDAIEVDYCQLYATAVATSPVDNATTGVSVTRAARYQTLTASEIGSKLTWDFVANEVARQQWLFYAASGAGVYVNASGKLVYRTASLGSDLLGGKGTMDDAAYWTTLTSVTVSGGKATFSGATSTMAKTLITTVGKTYKVSFDLTVRGGAIYYTGLYTTTRHTTSGSKSFYITAVSTTTQLSGDGAATDLDVDNLTIQEVKEITSTTTLSANTIYRAGIEQSAAGATLYLNGSAEATDATATTDVDWGTTVYVGSKVVTGTASETLNGTVSVIQSSSDAGFDAGGLL